MDFYWHYSGKDSIDAAGKESFFRAIKVASQVFNSITEYIQVNCWWLACYWQGISDGVLEVDK